MGMAGVVQLVEDNLAETIGSGNIERSHRLKLWPRLAGPGN